jgi:catechol 2,3-dioxygenase-like lactoylglutathione lyase family enzyme
MEPTLETTEPLAITGVSHIEFLVSDLEASSAWYQQVVGLVELPNRPPGRRSLELTPAAGGFRLGLTEKRPAEGQGMFRHLAISLESMDVLTGWVAHLDAAAVAHTPIKENPYRPGVFSIDVFDPDGHEIELIFEP